MAKQTSKRTTRRKATPQDKALVPMPGNGQAVERIVERLVGHPLSVQVVRRRRMDLTAEAMTLADQLGQDLVLSVDAVRAFQDRLGGYMGAARALAAGGTPAEA